MVEVVEGLFQNAFHTHDAQEGGSKSAAEVPSCGCESVHALEFSEAACQTMQADIFSSVLNMLTGLSLARRGSSGIVGIPGLKKLKEKIRHAELPGRR